MKPTFVAKGYFNPDVNRVFAAKIIDCYNSMLVAMVRQPELQHVKYVDLRNILRSDTNYQNDWANELHPTDAGFELLAHELDAALTNEETGDRMRTSAGFGWSRMR